MRALLGNVMLDVVFGETVNMRNSITEHPVETGQKITDHVRSEPNEITITGVCTDSAPEKIRTLREYRANANILTYTHRNVFTGMIIESLDTSHVHQNRLGFDFSIKLKRIKITSSMPATKVSTVQSSKGGLIVTIEPSNSIGANVSTSPQSGQIKTATQTVKGNTTKIIKQVTAR